MDKENLVQINFTKLQDHLKNIVEYFNIDSNGFRATLAFGEHNYLEDFIEEITKDDDINSKVSRKTLEETIWNVLGTLKINEDFSDIKIEEATKSIVVELKSMISKLQVYVPIEKLQFKSIRKLRVGNVTLYPANPLQSKLKVRLYRIINRRSTEDRYNIIKRKKMYRTYIDNSFADCLAIAEVVVEAEPDAVADIVDQEVDAALNLLRCFTTILQQYRDNPIIGIRGSLSSGIHHKIIFDNDEQNVSLDSRLVNGIGYYIIDPNRINYLRSKNAFNTLCCILSKPANRMSQMEKIIATAIRWIGKGVAAIEEPEKVMCFCIALEQMMNGGGRGDISERLATRLAFLLTDKCDDRIKLCSRAKELYKLRSIVVHTGDTKIQKKDIADLEDMAVKAMVCLAKNLNKWKTHDDFVKWIRGKQFG